MGRLKSEGRTAMAVLLDRDHLFRAIATSVARSVMAPLDAY